MAGANVVPIDALKRRAEDLRRKVMAGTLSKLLPEDWEALLETSERREYAFNEVILKQGVVGEAICMLTDGEVRIEREGRDGDTTQLARLGPGGIFGEMSFLDRSGASANVIADGMVAVLYIDGADLKVLTEQDPGFAARFYHSLAATLSRRLRATNEIIRGRA